MKKFYGLGLFTVLLILFAIPQGRIYAQNPALFQSSSPAWPVICYDEDEVPTTFTFTLCKSNDDMDACAGNLTTNDMGSGNNKYRIGWRAYNITENLSNTNFIPGMEYGPQAGTPSGNLTMSGNTFTFTRPTAQDFDYLFPDEGSGFIRYRFYTEVYYQSGMQADWVAERRYDLDIYKFRNEDVEPGRLGKKSRVGCSKGGELVFWPEKPGTAYSMDAQNGTFYNWTIKDPNGEVIASGNNMTEKFFYWTSPDVAGTYKLRIEWFKITDDQGHYVPWNDVLEQDLSILGAFAVTGPVGGLGTVTQDMYFYDDQMPWLRFNLEGATLIPGQVMIEARFYSKDYTHGSEDGYVYSDYVQTPEEIENWSMNARLWNQYKSSFDHGFAAVRFRLVTVGYDDNDEPTTTEIAIATFKLGTSTTTKYFYRLYFSPLDRRSYLTPYQQSTGKGAPESYYSTSQSGNITIGVTFPAIILSQKTKTSKIQYIPGSFYHNYSATYSYHGATQGIVSVYEVADNGTWTEIAQSNATDNWKPTGVTVGNYCAAIFQRGFFSKAANNNKHFAVKIHFKYVEDGVYYDMPESDDWIWHFRIGNKPTNTSVLTKGTVPCYNNGATGHADNWDNFMVFYGNPKFAVANGGLDIATLAGEAGKYCAVAATMDACLGHNEKAWQDYMVIKTVIPDQAAMNNFTWEPKAITTPCITTEGESYYLTPAEQIKCRYAVYFYPAYYDASGSIFHLGPALYSGNQANNTVNTYLNYFDVLPPLSEAHPRCNPVPRGVQYLPGETARIDYQIFSAYVDAIKSQGHAVFQIGVQKDGGAIDWSTPTITSSLYNPNPLGLWEKTFSSDASVANGNYVIHFRFQLRGENCSVGTTEGVDQFTETVNILVASTLNMPQITITPSEPAHVGTNTWYKPITVTLSLPENLATATIKYNFDNSSNWLTYTEPITVSNPNTTIYAYGVAPNSSYIEIAPNSQVFDVVDLGAQITHSIDTIDFGTFYSGQLEKDIIFRYKGLLDPGSTTTATVLAELWNKNKFITPFTLITPTPEEAALQGYSYGNATVNLESSLTELPVTVKFTWSDGYDEGNFIGWVVLTHAHLTGDTIRDTVYVKAVITRCSAPENVNVPITATPDVIFAKINMGGRGIKDYRYIYAESEAGLGSAVEKTLTGKDTASLSGLKSNTTYYYKAKRVCGSNGESDWTDIKTFTTLAPGVNITSPAENGQEFTGDVTVGFTVSNFNLGSAPLPLAEPYLPYGTAKIEFSQKGTVLDEYTVTGNTSGTVTKNLPNGAYTVTVTLNSVTPGSDKVADVSASRSILVNRPETAKPTFAVAPIAGTVIDGTVIYDSAELTVNCATGGALVEYSLDGGSIWKTYNAAAKPHIKSPDGTNTTVTVKAKASKTGLLNSDEAAVTYTVRPLYKVASAARLYDYYNTANPDYVPAASDKYFRIDGNLVVTHTDSSEATKRRIYVQDSGGRFEDGKRSLVIRVLSSHKNLNVKSYRKGDMFSGVIGQLVRQDSMMRFMPVNKAIAVKKSGVSVHVDTLTLAQIKSNKRRYQGNLACVTYVSFNDENTSFVYNNFYTMTCIHGQTMRLRTDFAFADYIQDGFTTPGDGTKFFITGILTQSNNIARIIPRSRADIVEAPRLKITTSANRNMGVWYANGATLNARVEFANYKGVPELELISKRGFTLNESDLANGNISVGYTCQGTAGKDTARIVAKYRDLTDTLTVWAESRLCADVAVASVTDRGQNTASLEFSEGYLRYEVDYKQKAESTWTSVVSNDNSYDFEGLNVGTEYDFRVKGVCADYPDMGVTVVKSGNFKTGEFKTVAQEAMTISLKPGVPANSNGPVHIEYTKENFDLADAPSIPGGHYGKVRICIFKYDGGVIGDTVVKEYTQNTVFDTFLPSGHYLASVLLVQIDGSVFDVADEDELQEIMSRNPFTVKLDDVAEPVIGIVGSPVSPKAGEYYDSAVVKITCTDPDAALYYSYDGETYTEYTRETLLKIENSGKIYAKSERYRMDDGGDTMALVIIHSPVKLTHTDGYNRYSYPFTTNSWNESFNDGYEIDVDSLRSDITLELRAGGEKSAIALTETVLLKAANGYRTSRRVSVKPATPLVGPGRYSDTVIIKTQGVEIGRITVNIAVRAFVIPAVSIEPEADVTPGYQREVDVTLAVNDAENTEVGYEIHYTLDGSVPDVSSPKFTAPFKLSNTTLPEEEITLKALAFDVRENEALRDTTKLENLLTAVYRLYNPAEFIHTHDEVLDAEITTVQTFTRELQHTVKYWINDINIVVVKRSSDFVTALKTDKPFMAADEFTGTDAGDAVNFTVSSVSGLAPGEYQDTVKITSAGQTLCQKVINLKVTQYVAPKEKLMPPVFEPEGGEFNDSVWVEIATEPETEGLEIYYRKDRTGAFKLYTGMLRLTDTTYVEAFVHIDDGEYENSDTTGFTFYVADTYVEPGEENPGEENPGDKPQAVKLASVRFAPLAVAFDDSVRVVLSHENPDAEIYYRLDNHDEFTLYTGSMLFTETTTVEAFAHIDGDAYINSDTTCFTFYVAESDPLAANEADGGLDVKVYPNPTAGKFNVLAPAGADVEVYSAAGVLVQRDAKVNGVRTYGMSAAGVYFVRVKLGEKMSVKRVIVR